MNHTTGLDSLAEQAVVVACELADAAGPDKWSGGAVEDAVTALGSSPGRCPGSVRRPRSSWR
ncbi:hypothetical protein [Streptomyces sp. P9-A4]|uniref:hypothetical protein n=1 Tax=Streptomyces sp. P9-A4 TaxID=3072285 RepID=UPI002FCB33D4